MLPLEFEYLVALQIMSFSGFIPEEEEEETIGWGLLATPAQENDLVSQAIRKEKIIKYIVSLSLVHSSNMDSVLNVILGK